MKRYKAYKAKKFKFPRRLLFFIVIAAIIFAIAVIAGNKLKAKVETTVQKDGGTTYDLETEKAQLETVLQTAEHDGALAMVSAGHFNTAGVTDSDKVRLEVARIREEGHNTVSFRVNSDDGSFTYASPALQEMTRLPASEKLFPYGLLCAIQDYAHYSGMRLSAVMTASADSSIDAAVAGELYSAGFDEILVIGFEGEEPEGAVASKINAYVEVLRKSAPVDFGVLLSEEVMTDSRNTPFIEKIFAKTEFLAIDMRDDDGDGAAAVVESIQGSFPAYMLRPLLDGSDAENAKRISDVLSGASVNARQYISSASRPADTTAASDED